MALRGTTARVSPLRWAFLQEQSSKVRAGTGCSKMMKVRARSLTMRGWANLTLGTI